MVELDRGPDDLQHARQYAHADTSVLGGTDQVQCRRPAARRQRDDRPMDRVLVE
jgi:hypothetical protein